MKSIEFDHLSEGGLGLDVSRRIFVATRPKFPSLENFHPVFVWERFAVPGYCVGGCGLGCRCTLGNADAILQSHDGLRACPSDRRLPLRLCVC